MNVTIFGSGYVGLVTGACLAQAGNNVVCVDIDADKVNRLKKGEIPIYEPGLDIIVNSNLEAGRLSFTQNIEDAVAHGLFQMIAVGTPPGEDGSADLAHVLTVAEGIGRHLDDYRVIVTKSTVPVGTADKVKQAIISELHKRDQQIDFDVVSNPEFLKEGAAVNDFNKPDRIVVGSDSERAIELMKQLYQAFNRNHDRMRIMDVKSAELTKYAANAMLATKISFMNELSVIAEKVGADIEQVRLGIGSDPRIGYHFIYPGCGYGGSCFPKDVKALIQTAIAQNCEPELLAAVESVNKRQKQWMFNKIKQVFSGQLQGKKIALWGLSFKPNTDDMREAASLELIRSLLEHDVEVVAYDPKSMDEAAKILSDARNIRYGATPHEVLEGADMLAICTEWEVFRSPDFDMIKSSLSAPVIVDGRNLYDPKQLEDLGIEYYAVGRGLSLSS